MGPSNLQLAWEMLEFAKVVYTKRLETAEETDKSPLLEKLCSTMLSLGEVSIENENYKQAVEDIQERIKNMEKLETDEAKKEVTELKALVPEIEEKINDTKDMKKEAEAKKEGATSSGDAFGSSKAAEVKPVSNIAVKSKA